VITPEPIPETESPSAARGPVAYVEVRIGERLYKIYDGESKIFRTGGSAVQLNAVTLGKKPTRVLYKVESYGWKYEYVHPYTYTFPQRNGVYNTKPMSIRVHTTGSDGKLYVTRFTLQLS